ncbi:MAG: hypothetical protein AAB215_02610 [Planctomycetota bacterium]
MGKTSVFAAGLVGAVLGAGLAVAVVANFGESLGLANRRGLEASAGRMREVLADFEKIKKGQEEVLALFKETRARAERIDRHLAVLEQERFGAYQARLDEFDARFKDIVAKHVQLHKDTETVGSKAIEEIRKRLDELEKAFKIAAPAPK